MSEVQARQNGAVCAGPARPAAGQNGLLIVLGIVLAGALFVLALLSSGSTEPVVLAIMAILAMVGVFFLFGLAAGLITVGEMGSHGHVALALTEELADGVQITARDGSVIYDNPAFRELTAAGEGGRAQSLENLFAGEPAAAEALFRLSCAAERGETCQEEFRVHARGAAIPGQTRRAHQTRWYRLSVQVLDGETRDGSGKPLTAWRLADITTERATQSDAMDAHQALCAEIENLPVGLMTITGEGRISSMNRALARWLGRHNDALGGRGLWLSDIAGIDATALLRALMDAPGTGEDEPRSFDIEALGNDGRPVLLRLLRPVLGEGSGAASNGEMSLVVLNRTEHGAPASAADATDPRLARFFQTAPFGIATVDKNGRITSKNGAFSRMFLATKASRSSTISGFLSRKCDKEARDRVVTTLQRVIKKGGSVEPVEITFGPKGEYTRRIYMTPFSGGKGAREAAILYVVDTTEQKALELKFAQSQKMEAVGQLAGGIAHDFNNVLTVIIGLSDLFLQTRRPTDAGYNDIVQIRSNANRAAGLVRQLLAFSRKQTLSPEVLQLNDVVQDLGYSLSRLIGERVQLKMNCQRDLWLVKADQTQFEQVVINLAVNARDAMPDGGKLTIRTRNVTERDSAKLADLGVAPGEYVLVEARDTGVGMTPDVLEKIFEPFYSTKDVGKGTGLGLSTVYGIVKQTGGYVFPDSKPGKGTSFKVYLPRHAGGGEDDDVAESRAGKKEPPRDLTGTGCVLLVEDEDQVRAFEARALQRQGYEVLEASTGVEALEVMAANEGRVDIVVSDVVMPEMDGPSLLKELRKTSPDLKIIFVSGYPDDAFAKSLGEDEPYAFLPKPFTLSQLATKVKEQLEG